MEKMKISQVAKKLGVTTQAVYKKLATVGNKLQPNLVKESGVTYILPDGIEYLQESFGKKQQEPVATVGNQVDSVVASFEKCLKEQKEIIGGLQRTIDTLISQHAEERTRTADERTRADTIIMKLTNDVGNLQKVIEHKTQEKEQKSFEVLEKAPPVVQAWKPERPADPLEGLGFLERIWVQFVEPQKMRRYDS